MIFKKSQNDIEITFSNMDDDDEKNLATILYEGLKAIKDRDLPYESWEALINQNYLHTLILFVQTYYNSHQRECGHWDKSVWLDAWGFKEEKK